MRQKARASAAVACQEEPVQHRASASTPPASLPPQLGSLLRTPTLRHSQRHRLTLRHLLHLLHCTHFCSSRPSRSCTAGCASWPPSPASAAPAAPPRTCSSSSLKPSSLSTCERTRGAVGIGAAGRARATWVPASPRPASSRGVQESGGSHPAARSTARRIPNRRDLHTRSPALQRPRVHCASCCCSCCCAQPPAAVRSPLLLRPSYPAKSASAPRAASASISASASSLMVDMAAQRTIGPAGRNSQPGKMCMRQGGGYGSLAHQSPAGRHSKPMVGWLVAGSAAPLPWQRRDRPKGLRGARRGPAGHAPGTGGRQARHGPPGRRPAGTRVLQGCQRGDWGPGKVASLLPSPTMRKSPAPRPPKCCTPPELSAPRRRQLLAPRGWPCANLIMTPAPPSPRNLQPRPPPCRSLQDPGTGCTPPAAGPVLWTPSGQAG